MLPVIFIFLSACSADGEETAFDAWYSDTYEDLLEQLSDAVEDGRYEEGRLAANEIITSPPGSSITLEQFRSLTNEFEPLLGELLDHSPGGRLSNQNSIPIELNRELPFSHGMILLMLESGYIISNEPDESPIRTIRNYDEAIRISSRLRVDFPEQRVLSGWLLSDHAWELASMHPGSTVTKARMLEYWSERKEQYRLEICASYPTAIVDIGAESCAVRANR